MRARQKSETPRDEELLAYLEGYLPHTDSAQVEMRLADSADARKRLAQLRAIRDGLRDPGPELARIDLVPALDRAIATGVDTPSRRARTPIWIASLLTMAAAVALIVLREPTLEFRAKSAMEAMRSPTRAAVRIHRPVPKQSPAPVNTEFSRREGLLVSYTNVGADPFTHLMVFAVDADAEVRWFYPAYLVAGTDPASVAIEPDQVRKMLDNEISHKYALGPLTLYALFTHVPLHVSAVESWLTAERFNPEAPPLKEAKLQSLDLRVLP